MRSVKLSGGEPTVRNDLAEIVDIISAAGLRVTLITNGIRLREDLLAALKRTKSKVKFSLHYPDERNDEIFGNRSFSKIRENARQVIEGGIDFSINTVIQKNRIGIMEQMVQLAIDWKCRKISFLPLIYRGAARGGVAESEMNLETYRAVRLTADELRIKHSQIDVRLIDFRAKEYWVVDNDGRLFISAETEERDRVLGRPMIIENPAKYD